MFQSDLEHNIFKKRYTKDGTPVETHAKKEGESH